MNNLVRFLVCLLAVIGLVGCADKPSRADLTAALHAEAIQNMNRTSPLSRINRDFISINAFRTISSENIGNKVNPKFIGRFTANIQLNEDAYAFEVLHPRNEGISVPVILSVALSEKKNYLTAFSGVYQASVSRLDSDGKNVWNIVFSEFRSMGRESRGAPLYTLGPVWEGQTELSKNNYYHVLAGSEEEQAVLAYFDSLEQETKKQKSE